MAAAGQGVSDPIVSSWLVHYPILETEESSEHFLLPSRVQTLIIQVSKAFSDM